MDKDKEGVTPVVVTNNEKYSIFDNTSYTIGDNLDQTITFYDNDHVNLVEWGHYSDPYHELELINQKTEKEEKMRSENNSLKEAWDHYQLILRLVEEEECDKYLKEQYKDTGKK